MDGKRFDTLTKSLANGASRRTILKGLLGLGGSAAVASAMATRTDARRRSSSSGESTTTTPEPLCPDGTTPCDSNSTGCCADCGSGVTCGYDCCDSAAACCDNECCPAGEVCVANQINCSNYFCEERCCLDSQICDGRCCHGICYSPLDSGLAGYDRACCPPLAGFTFCPGGGDYAGQGLCCSGDSPDCCNGADGRPYCLSPDQCCTDAECAGLTDPSQCLVGVCSDFYCIAQTLCPEGQSCCPGLDNLCCPTGQDCCLRDSALLCLDPAQCCTDAECTEFDRSFCNLESNACDCTPLTCADFAQQGMCGTGPSNGCGDSLDCGCGENQQCCQETNGEPGFCRPAPGCCTIDDCDPPPDACTTVTCTLSATCEYTGCQTGLDCCERDSDDGVVGTCINPLNQCCDTGDCEEFGFDYDCIDCNDIFSCVPDDEGEQCDENDCHVCNQGYCQPATNDTQCDDGVCCDGFCYEVDSCSSCGLAGTQCSADDECCSDRCCDDYCINLDQCCDSSDCGSVCLACRENSCVFTCQVDNDCCGSTQTCNELLGDGLGECVACRQPDETCNEQSGPDCCEGSKCCNGTCCDEFCIFRSGGNTCESCVPLNKFGCDSTNDCCTGKCVSGACICLMHNQGNCDQDSNCCQSPTAQVCTDTGENNHNGYCRDSCMPQGAACGSGIGIDCCYGHRCIGPNADSLTCQPY